MGGAQVLENKQGLPSLRNTHLIVLVLPLGGALWALLVPFSGKDSAIARNQPRSLLDPWGPGCNATMQSRRGTTAPGVRKYPVGFSWCNLKHAYIPIPLASGQILVFANGNRTKGEMFQSDRCSVSAL